MSLAAHLQSFADETDFSGVVAVSSGGVRLAELNRGFADRARRRANTIDTRFAIASASKGMTALTVASLIESGQLGWDTTLRSLVGDALPLVDPAVTIEHLLGHTSGVGDYLDEDVINDIENIELAIAANRLASPRDFLPLLDGLPQKSPPGARFAYTYGGYVMLSIAVEAATGATFHDLVQERVFDPAGIVDSGFFRSDERPPRAAVGYLADGATNALCCRCEAPETAVPTRRRLISNASGRRCSLAGSCRCRSSNGSSSPATAIPRKAAATGWGSGFEPIDLPSCSKARTPACRSARRTTDHRA